MKKIIIKVLQDEIKWSQKYCGYEDKIDKAIKKGFLNGLRTAIFLIRKIKV